ncbi:MAG: addiction module protein [Gemmatimonadota bacterium]
MRRNPAFDFSHLSAAERIQLAEDLWDSIEPEDDALALTPEQRAELDRRLADLDANPGDAIPWEEVRAKLVAQFKLPRGG